MILRIEDPPLAWGWNKRGPIETSTRYDDQEVGPQQHQDSEPTAAERSGADEFEMTEGERRD